MKDFIFKLIALTYLIGSMAVLLVAMVTPFLYMYDECPVHMWVVYPMSLLVAASMYSKPGEWANEKWNK